jgi:hypothetical protein
MTTTGEGGHWIGYGPGPSGKDHLPPDVRAEAERLEAIRKEHQGRLLCEVHVRVFENDVVPGVAFPADGLLDVESNPAEVAAAVDRARDALARWR